MEKRMRDCYLCGAENDATNATCGECGKAFWECCYLNSDRCEEAVNREEQETQKVWDVRDARIRALFAELTARP